MQQANKDQDQHGSVKDRDILIEHSAETYYLLLFKGAHGYLKPYKA